MRERVKRGGGVGWGGCSGLSSGLSRAKVDEHLVLRDVAGIEGAEQMRLI